MYNYTYIYIYIYIYVYLLFKWIFNRNMHSLLTVDNREKFSIHVVCPLASSLKSDSGFPASWIKVGNSIVRSEKSKMVGKREEKQCSITRPTAFEDGAVNYISNLYLLPASKTSDCIGALLSSSFLLLHMSLQILCRSSLLSENRLWIFFQNRR